MIITVTTSVAVLRLQLDIFPKWVFREMLLDIFLSLHLYICLLQSTYCEQCQIWGFIKISEHVPPHTLTYIPYSGPSIHCARSLKLLSVKCFHNFGNLHQKCYVLNRRHAHVALLCKTVFHLFRSRSF